MTSAAPELLTELQIDALTELVNLGVSRAASTLRDMVGAQVHLSVPKVSLEIRSKAIAILSERETADLVAVHQVFEGDVIARHNGGVRETFTVRRLVQGEGVERIFPIHSPRIAKIVVKKAGAVRRAKLYYLRDRVGKATKIKDDVKRQSKIDADLKAAAEAANKAAQAAAAKATAEGGISKTAQKKKARKEAEAAKKK